MDYAVNIPYVSTTMYKRVASDYTLTTMLDNTSTAEEYSLGSLAFYLVAPIVSITSTLAPTVTALMWIAAAEDFQFSSYAGQLHRMVFCTPMPLSLLSARSWSSLPSHFGP
jgi:hypothetical protein